MPVAREKRSRTPHEFVWVVPLRRVFPWWYLMGLVVTFAVIVAFGSVTWGSAGALWGPVIGLEIKDRQERAARRMKEGLPVQRSDLNGPRLFEVGTALIFSAICAGIAVSVGALFDGADVGLLVAGLCLFAGGGLGVLVLLIRGRALRATNGRPGSEEHVTEGEHDYAHNNGNVARGVMSNQFHDAQGKIEYPDDRSADGQYPH